MHKRLLIEIDLLDFGFITAVSQWPANFRTSARRFSEVKVAVTVGIENSRFDFIYHPNAYGNVTGILKKNAIVIPGRGRENGVDGQLISESRF